MSTDDWITERRQALVSLGSDDFFLCACLLVRIFVCLFVSNSGSTAANQPSSQSVITGFIDNIYMNLNIYRRRNYIYKSLSPLLSDSAIAASEDAIVVLVTLYKNIAENKGGWKTERIKE